MSSPPPQAQSMSSSSSENYYANIVEKWETEYPSSEEIDEIWSFYKECGYNNPQATLRSMLFVDDDGDSDKPSNVAVSFTKNRILDYGCDKGLMLDFFCKSAATASVGVGGGDADAATNTKLLLNGYGVDINPAAINQAKMKFPSMEFRVSRDGLTIPYGDKFFDVVLVMATIKHVRYEDRAQVYKELNRVSDYALMIEADKHEQEMESFSGWTFYNSNFEQEFRENFESTVKIRREGGDLLGLYKCKG